MRVLGRLRCRWLHRTARREFVAARVWRCLECGRFWWPRGRK